MYTLHGKMSQFWRSHVFFKRSTDSGKSFGSIKDFGPGGSPQLDTISSNVYVVWANGDDNIAFKASTNNGASFGSTKILSNDGDSANPQISSSGNAVRIVWEGGTRKFGYILQGKWK